MAIIPDVPHPLQRDGRSQNQRLVKALTPPASAEEARRNGSAMVDERSLADLLDFILRFARQVKFQSLKLKGNNGQTKRNGNGISGKTTFDDSLQEEDLISQSDWATLFRQDPVFVIAAISKTNTTALLEEFEEHVSDANRFQQFEGLHLLFDLCISILFQIHNWYTTLKLEPVYFSDERNGRPNQKTVLTAEKKYQPFSQSIQDIVSTNLLGTIKQLIAFSNAAKEHWGYEPYRGFKELETWDSTLDLAKKDTTLIDTKGSIRTKVKIAIQQLSLIFNELYGSLQEIVSRAEDALNEVIKNKSYHQPHIGLIIAFIRLLEKARTNPEDITLSYLNAATKKHLDFFYKEVLNLTTKPAKPDHAHLVFELAKELNEVKLDKNTAYLGGKDANGTPIVFKLDDEIIVTKAQVTDLHTLYLKKKYRKTPKDLLSKDIVEDVFFAPIANSADGLGEDFPKDTLAAWKTLGWDEGKVIQKSDPPLLEQKYKPYPTPELSFALASKALHLTGGRRRITLTWNASFPITKEDNSQDLIQDFNANFEAFKKIFNTRFEITPQTIEIMEKEAGLKNAAEGLNAIISANKNNPIERFEDLRDHFNEAFKISDEPLLKEYHRVLNKAVQRNHGFDLFLSGEKEWIRPYDVAISSSLIGQKLQVTVVIDLDESIPAVTWFNPAISSQKLDTSLPVVKLVLNNSQKFGESNFSLYHFFRFFEIQDLKISVEVCNFNQLLVQTEEGVQDSSKPFMPFGAVPKIGSSFYLGSDEIFRKRWNNIVVNVLWKDKPTDFKTHYADYIVGGLEDTNFKIIASLLAQKNWNILSPDPLEIFKKYPLPEAWLCKTKNDLVQSRWCLASNTPNQQNDNLSPLEPFNQFSKEGFIRFDLSIQTFQHEKFPQVFARQIQAQALLALDPFNLVSGALYTEAVGGKRIEQTPGGAAINNTTHAVNLPLEPYTPVIESLSVDYSAETFPEDITVYHLYPFAGTFEKKESLTAVSILPKFEDEGTLFLGISNLKPGENLDILFQVAESTADPDLMPAEVMWSYLSSNVWKNLKKDVDILSDETEGFLRSGVVKISVPTDIDQNNTILPANRHWLKASAHQRAGATSETVAVRTQAARATFAPESNSDTNRLIAPLPAESIAKALVANAAIKQISQPYPTFGGSPAESMPHFYQRISEHLRHKGRAITLFDYERLVLEYFPEVFKIKCITHSLGLPDEARDFHAAPGHVIVAIIPDLSKLEFADRFQPKATRNLLDRVEDFLKLRTSPFVQIRALNPRYQLFRVSGNVRFTKGKSEDFYKKQLQKDLDQFLAPWAFGEKDKIDFGGVVYKSVILKFIESLEYVDYVTNFLLHRKKEIQLGKHVAPPSSNSFLIGGRIFSPLEIQSIHDELSATTKQIPAAQILTDNYLPVDKIVADTARSILVSEEHVFTALVEECCQKGGNSPDLKTMKGLGYIPIQKEGSCDSPVKGTREPRCDQPLP